MVNFLQLIAFSLVRREINYAFSALWKSVFRFINVLSCVQLNRAMRKKSRSAKNEHKWMFTDAYARAPNRKIQYHFALINTVAPSFSITPFIIHFRNWCDVAAVVTAPAHIHTSCHCFTQSPSKHACIRFPISLLSLFFVAALVCHYNLLPLCWWANTMELDY